LKFKKPNPSYWNLGLGISLRGDNIDGLRKTGYYFKLGRCFGGVICASTELGYGNITKLKELSSISYGTFVSVAGVVDVYLNENLFFETAYGKERSNYTTYSKTTQDFVNFNLGVSLNPMNFFSVTIHGGVRKYFDNQDSRGTISPGLKILTNFKW